MKIREIVGFPLMVMAYILILFAIKVSFGNHTMMEFGELFSKFIPYDKSKKEGL